MAVTGATLDLGVAGQGMVVDRLEIIEGEWTEEEAETSNGIITLRSQGKHFIFVIQKP